MTVSVSGIRAVLFDLDGTLLDSAPDLAGAANVMLQRRGRPARAVGDFRCWAGAGARGMLRVAFEVTPEHADYEVLKREFLDEYQNCLTADTSAFDGVPELIEALSCVGLTWGVVTNKAERFTLPLTRAMAIFDGAATVVSGDTTPHAKPHPAPLLEAARRAGISPAHCVYVGDDLRDIQAGRSAGMRTVVARYGYLGPEADVSTWEADAVIEKPLDLLKWLELP